MQDNQNQQLQPQDVLIASPNNQTTNQIPINPQPIPSNQPNNLPSSGFGEEELSFWDKTKAHLIDLFIFVAVVSSIILVVHKFVAEPHKVSGSSMVPNFKDGDFIITNKIATNFYSLHRGEIIIFTSPRDASKVFIKRIIALSQDKIRIQNGKVYLNDKQINEPYLPAGTNTPTQGYLSEGEEILIPDNQYFVIGDNRGASSDSREWGPAKKELIIGQAWLRYWPINKLGIILHQ